MADFPCEECQYWPIYPCYSATKPMVDCLAVYDNDAIAVESEDPDTYSTARAEVSHSLGHTGLRKGLKKQINTIIRPKLC